MGGLVLFYFIIFSRLTTNPTIPTQPQSIQGSDHEVEEQEEVLFLNPEVNEFEHENEEDDMVDETNNPSDSLAISSIQDVFAKAKEHFGLKFTSAKQKIKYGLDIVDKSMKNIKFLVKPDLQDSYLKNPKGTDTDPIGLWGVNDLIFKHKNHWVPEAHAKEHPRRVPFKFLDSDSEKFFVEKHLITPGKKFNLPTSIFSPNSVVINDTKMHDFEYWGRQGVLDNEITQNMLDLNFDMVLGVSNVLKSLDLNAPEASVTLNAVVENLQNVLNFNTLSRQSNYRCKTFAILTCVKAKSELRSMVLNRYEDDANIKEMLMCSSFFSDNLFGPLPKSLTEVQPNCSGRKALLSSKFNSNPVKRKPHQVNSQSKRGKFDWNRGNYNNNNFNDKSNYNNGGSHTKNNTQETRYATSSLFPRGAQQSYRSRGGRRGSKR